MRNHPPGRKRKHGGPFPMSAITVIDRNSSLGPTRPCPAETAASHARRCPFAGRWTWVAGLLVAVLAGGPVRSAGPEVPADTARQATPADEAESLLARARELAGTGAFADALPLFTRVTELAPGNYRGHSGRASALNNLDRYAEGLAAIERAVALAPDNAMLYYNRGLSLAEVGRFEAAIADFDAAIRGRPELPMPYADRAAARMGLGQVQAALEDCESALRADATYIWARYYRGQLRYLQGDFQAAAGDFAAVVESQPAFGPARLWHLVSVGRGGTPEEPAQTPEGMVGSWPAPLVAHLRGNLDAAALLRVADEQRVVDDERRRSAAHVAIGLRHLFLGEPDAARRAFEAAVAFQVPAHFEQQVARVELARLGSRRSSS